MNTDELVQLITEAIREKLSLDEKLLVPVGVSARHVHVCREHLDILFGKGYELTKKKDLMGGQFAAEECVTVVGAKLSSIEKVRILGPLRAESQVEVSKTDAIKLGLNAPVRESGKIKGSAPITLVGPKGSVTLAEGCIVAKRHIHMSPEEALKFGLKDNSVVDVKIPGERGGIMSGVQVRVHSTYTLEMHIDTDEANSFGIPCGAKLEVVKA